MIIILPQMNSFHSKCEMGYPSEDCRIYDIHFMWPVLLTQSILCVVVLAIKCVMVRIAYSLYWVLHEHKSPLLSTIANCSDANVCVPIEWRIENEGNIEQRLMMITVPFVSITHNTAGILETARLVANTTNTANGNGHCVA